MRTGVRVEMGVYDFTAKEDLAVECSRLQGFAGLDCFRGEALQPEKYATFEPGRFVLDGSMPPFPDDMQRVEWGLWGSEMSDVQTGLFREPVELRFKFGGEHECIGLTFYFEQATGERAGQMLVRWLNGAGVEIARYRSRPTGAVWFLKKLVSGFTEIAVSFYGTEEPGRYLKVNGIEFGTRKLFGEDEILAARVLEELDPTGSELHAGQLELEVLSRDAEFSILNPGGIYYGLRQQQRMVVQCVQGGKTLDFGTYYLTEWQSDTEHSARFEATDVVGLLELVPFDGGLYGTTAAAFAEELLQGYAYELEPALRAERVEGWLAAGTKRDALQQFAFAIGAVVDTSRDGVMKIYAVQERPSAYISYDRKLLGSSSVVQRAFVSGVQVMAHRYSAGGEESQLFSAQLAAGTHTLRFAKPCSGYRAQGASLLRQHPNFVELRVGSAGTVTVWGWEYNDNTVEAWLDSRTLDSGEDANVVRVEQATLLAPGNAVAAARRLAGYYARRYKQQFRMALGEEKLGDTVIVGSFHREKLKGIIECVEIDLAGGMLAEVTVYGQRMDSRWMYYTGELPAGLGGVV